MTLSATARVAGPYPGNGSLTTFAYDFKIFLANELGVYIDDTLQPSSAYSVTGVGVATGGDVIFVVAPLSGTTVRLFGDLAVEQQVIQLAPGGGISSSGMEEFADKLVMMMLERLEELERRPAFKQATALRNLLWPDPVALGLIGYNATADGLITSPATILQVTPDAVTGLAFVKTPITVNSSAGPQLTAANAFPAGVRPLAAVARVTTSFGTSSGLTALMLGDPDEGEDVWASTMGITDVDISTAGQNRPGGLENPSGRDVLITALGGDFDATGQIKITTVGFTLTPDA